MINKNFLNKKFLFITLTSLIAISSIYLIPEVYKRKYWLKTNFPKLFILYKNAQFKLESFQNERKSKLEVEQIKKPVDELETHWHPIKKEIIQADGYLSYQPRMSGGYMDFLNENLIIASNGVGNIFSYDFLEKKFKKINSNLNDIYIKQDFKGKVIEKLKGTFSVKDLFLDKTKSRLLASINLEIGKDTACYGLGILQAKLPKDFDKGLEENIEFIPFFKTKECNIQFFGHGAGGRIKRLNERIIFTVGDHDHNLHGDIKIPQNRNNAIGKVISIDENGNFEVLSMGHRNQQGLTIFDNKIFTTEHGPKGGDELNQILSNKHYGWPYYSYGFADLTGADVHRHPHEGKYEKPIYYFSPSIGISEVVFYKGLEFPFWQNKFIVASMKEKSLYLLDYDKENNKVLSQEKILIGHRIRDLNIAPSGKLLIITDDAKIIRLSLDKTKRTRIDKKIIINDSSL